MSGAVAAILADGRRLHLQHGPIDLIVDVDGDRDIAYRAARDRFDTVLAELVTELPALRSACPPAGRGFDGAIARRMEAAVRPHAAAGLFVTPMAAVAGAVAEEVLAAMLAALAAADRPPARAYVNNGGDIALHLAPGQRFDLAVARLQGGGGHGRLRLAAEDPVRGVATSGRGGRSHSLGIAEAVTVLAGHAATADAAATLIGNAVDLPGHPAIRRVAARDLDPDSDLGDRPVVTECGALTAAEADAALARGLAAATAMQAAGLLHSAALFLQGEARVLADAGGLLVGAADRPISDS